MGNKQVGPGVIIGVVVVLVAVIGFVGYKSAVPPQPAPGSYTPGTPPWLDKSSPDYGKGPQAVSSTPGAGAAPGGGPGK